MGLSFDGSLLPSLTAFWNDKLPSFPAMTRRIALMVFNGFQLQSVAGPLSAFEVANRFSPYAYSLEPVAPHPGQVTSSVGLSLSSCAPCAGPFDTILIPGGAGLQDPALLRALLAWLDTEAPVARRVASICTGAYVAAEAGLLDGLRATTHWDAALHFSRRYPRVRLQPDEIVVRDGSVWTSAGSSAGIDLALALIEDDFGWEVSEQVARQLVVPHRRAGGQLQYSSLLGSREYRGQFSDLLQWIGDHIADQLTVDDLARQAAMSPRNFARVFRADTGLTPAKAIERMRLEVARSRLAMSRDPVEQVAKAVGFHDPERMRRAFLRAFGQSPQSYRRANRRGKDAPDAIDPKVQTSFANDGTDWSG